MWKILILISLTLNLFLLFLSYWKSKLLKFWLTIEKDGIWAHKGIPKGWSHGIRLLKYPWNKEER